MLSRALASVALALSLTGCAWSGAFMQTVRDVAIKGGPPAVVAVACAPLGPLVIGCAVFGTVVIMDLVTEKSVLLSGEKIGSGALDREMERWKTAYQLEKGARIAAKSGESFYRKWRWRILWGAIAYFIFLRRKPIGEFFSGKVVVSRLWALIHAFIGANWTRKLAYGFDFMPKAHASETTIDPRLRPIRPRRNDP